MLDEVEMSLFYSSTNFKVEVSENNGLILSPRTHIASIFMESYFKVDRNCRAVVEDKCGLKLLNLMESNLKHWK